jgi:hypothetical protein
VTPKVPTRRGVALLLACVAWLVAPPASAQVREAAQRLEHEWRSAGATVVRGQPRFLNDEETFGVAVDPAPGECTTLGLVGARGMSFHARVTDPAEDEERAPPTASVGGVLEIWRCADGAPAAAEAEQRDARDPRASPGPDGTLRRVAVTADAGRGAIEIVIAHSRTPVPSLQTILTERTGGPLPTPPETGGLPPLPPPDKRADVAEARARRDGGHLAARDTWEAGGDGSGEGHVMLDAGCHRVELFAVDPRTSRAARRFRLDLDAELRGEDKETLLARDRTDAPDARLELCVGVATQTSVVFAGSPPNAPIVVTHTSWPIPPRLPLTWGQETRARMAGVMVAHHVPALGSEAIAIAQGPSGLTPVPLDVEPGGCYVAVVAIDHGHTRGVGLRVVVGARTASDDRGSGDESALVSFCAGDQSHARAEVEARGMGIGWGLALFRVASGAWGPMP